MNSFRICITGGSGFIGTTAMQWAIDQSFEVINFDIRPPKILGHQPYWKYVDIREKDQFTSALEAFRPTHIWHLAAMTGMDIEDMSFFYANTIGVQNLLEASTSLPDLQRILFTSSLLVCRNGYVPHSDTEYCPPNLYGESKVIGEKMIRESQLSCDWVIVRPTSIWGPWFEYSYKKFFQVLDLGLYLQPGKKPIIKPLSYVGNTVHMMQKLLLYHGTEVSKRTFYLCDYPQNSIQEWADLIRTELGKSGKTLVFPIGGLRLLAKVGDVCKVLGWNDPPLTSFRLNNILTGAYYPIEKIQEIVNELPFSLQQGVRQTLVWMERQGLLCHKLTNGNKG